MSNIYLVGMMGSGKSVTGKKLAPMLSVEFTDLDDRIERKTGRLIREIFEKEGEPYFREQEAELLKEAAASGPCVVATGGGAVLRPENVKLMRETGKVVYLETSLETLWRRVKEKKDRPLLRNGEPKQALARILGEREAFYKTACDFQVNTDSQKAEAVAKKIFEMLGGKK